MLKLIVMVLSSILYRLVWLPSMLGNIEVLSSMVTPTSSLFPARLSQSHLTGYRLGNQFLISNQIVMELDCKRFIDAFQDPFIPCAGIADSYITYIRSISGFNDHISFAFVCRDKNKASH
ncbi:hypothetical protein LguiB_006356 [Lonicera macranthoides]